MEIDATYVLPLRAAEPVSEELTEYLRRLSAWCSVVVVDNSAPPVFDAHHRHWSAFVEHVRPDPALRTRNGKVANVLTGLGLARSDAVVIADDDVRYDRAALERVVRLLDHHDVVRPQNVFATMPWHAVWDTGRTLLNRAVAADYPGTLGVRRSVLEATGGYDGDVLFENLELLRTVEAAGGTCVAPLDLYVPRLAPTAAHFRSQRVRQAYDSLAQPGRLAAELALLPGVALAVATGRRRQLWGLLAAIWATAAAGRARAGGRAVFPAAAVAAAPLWVGERAVCIWVAVAWRLLRGGCRYGDTVVVRAASSTATLRRRLASRPDGAPREPAGP